MQIQFTKWFFDKFYQVNPFYKCLGRSTIRHLLKYEYYGIAPCWLKLSNALGFASLKSANSPVLTKICFVPFQNIFWFFKSLFIPF